MKTIFKNRSVWGWWFYDWANSAFALTALALFFPIFFKNYWNSGVDPTISTARLGVGHLVAGLCIACLSPLLGAMAGISFGKKRMLAAMLLLGTSCMALLFFIPQSRWLAALILFLLARMGFALGNLFYDSLLPDISESGQHDLISSFGYGFGYLGCGILGLVNVLMVLHPEWFGIADKTMAVKIAFLSVAIWWGLFSLPLFFWVREKSVPVKESRKLFRRSLRSMINTARDIYHTPQVLLFLIAFWLYHDGVHAFVMMATDFGLSIGIPESGLMSALLIVQFVAFPAAILFGYLAGRIGAKNTILIAIGIYLAVCLGGALYLKTQGQFLFLAALTGSAQGAIQALSRSMFTSMIPEEKASDYFGFYNLVGRFSVVLGPGLIGGMGLLGRRIGLENVAAARFGIASLAVLFIGGGVLLMKVKTCAQPSAEAC